MRSISYHFTIVLPYYCAIVWLIHDTTRSQRDISQCFESHICYILVYHTAMNDSPDFATIELIYDELLFISCLLLCTSAATDNRCLSTSSSFACLCFSSPSAMAAQTATSISLRRERARGWDTYLACQI